MQLFGLHATSYSSRLEQACEEVLSLSIDDDEGREVFDVDLPDGLHSQLGVLQDLHLTVTKGDQRVMSDNLGTRECLMIT